MVGSLAGTWDGTRKCVPAVRDNGHMIVTRGVEFGSWAGSSGTSVGHVVVDGFLDHGLRGIGWWVKSWTSVGRVVLHWWDVRCTCHG